MATGGRVFSHLWSLAIEEQYYLLIAPLVLLLRRERCIAVFAACLVIAPVARAAAFHGFQPAFGNDGAGELVKLLTPLQFDSFMLGGLLAFREDWLRSLSGRTFAVLAAVIVVIVAACLAANAFSLAQAGYLTRPAASLDFSEMADWRLSATSLRHRRRRVAERQLRVVIQRLGPGIRPADRDGDPLGRRKCGSSC